MPPASSAELARVEAEALLGARVSDVELLRVREDCVVAAVGPHVLKLTGPASDARRTVAVVARAREAGVPVPPVVATAASVTRPGWRCVLSERARGEPWQTVLPGLSPPERTGVHADLADVLLALRSVRFPAPGELRAAAGGLLVDGGGSVTSSLRRRAALRVRDPGLRAAFERVLEREAELLERAPAAVLCHDDLHWGNVLVVRTGSTWRLSAVLDWDKAWAGPAESDLARVGFWDGMTGPGFWARYRAVAPAATGEQRRALVHRLLWCFEREDPSPRHAADTAALCRALGVRQGG